MKKLYSRYSKYEKTELARRASRKKKVAPITIIMDKNIPVNRGKRKLSLKGFTKAIGNPYGTKFPKAKTKLEVFY